jgi:hypothetical protein
VLIFVWNPSDLRDPRAFDRFSSILEGQRALYSGLFGCTFHPMRDPDVSLLSI